MAEQNLEQKTCPIYHFCVAREERTEIFKDNTCGTPDNYVHCKVYRERDHNLDTTEDTGLDKVLERLDTNPESHYAD